MPETIYLIYLGFLKPGSEILLEIATRPISSKPTPPHVMAAIDAEQFIREYVNDNSSNSSKDT